MSNEPLARLTQRRDCLRLGSEHIKCCIDALKGFLSYFALLRARGVPSIWMELLHQSALTLGAATALLYALLGGFEPAGDHSILPWTAGFLTQATALRR